MRERIEKMFDVKLPRRLAKFWGTSEHLRYNKRKITGVSLYSKDCDFWLRFDDLGFLREFRDLKRDGDLRSRRAVVPLSALHLGRETEPQFLAVDFEDPKHPVLSWEHETGRFRTFSPSLDAFLRSTRDPKELSPFHRLVEAYVKASALYRAGKLAEAFKLLAPTLAPFSAKSITDGSDAPIQLAYQLLGRLHHHLGRPKEALAAFKISGETMEVVEVLRAKREWKKLIAATGKADYTVALLYRGLAYWQLGETRKASAIWRRALARFDTAELTAEYWILLRSFGIELRACMAPAADEVDDLIRRKWIKRAATKPKTSASAVRAAISSAVAIAPDSDYINGRDRELPRFASLVFEHAARRVVDHLDLLDDAEIAALLAPVPVTT